MNEEKGCRIDKIQKTIGWNTCELQSALRFLVFMVDKVLDSL
ncbi:hypothetical protein [uncultured Sphaerochaeta sp.]|nr:hypothetical protein [uncultured Sphaerochaeta sp.]